MQWLLTRTWFSVELADLHQGLGHSASQTDNLVVDNVFTGEWGPVVKKNNIGPHTFWHLVSTAYWPGTSSFFATAASAPTGRNLTVSAYCAESGIMVPIWRGSWIYRRRWRFGATIYANCLCKRVTRCCSCKGVTRNHTQSSRSLHTYDDLTSRGWKWTLFIESMTCECWRMSKCGSYDKLEQDTHSIITATVDLRKGKRKIEFW